MGNSDRPLNNRAVCIGWTGRSKLYLNVPREEAIRRYAAEQGYDDVPDSMVEEFMYDDEIDVYAAYPVRDDGWVK